ncbi:MAG: hypothetical protein ACLS43_04550 [Evtepia gabavorous]
MPGPGDRCGAVNMDLIAGLPADANGIPPDGGEVYCWPRKHHRAHPGPKGPASRREETPPSGTDVAAMLDFAWAAPPGRLSALLLVPAKFLSGSFENVGWCKPGFVNVYNICMMEELHTVLSLGAGGVTKLVEGGVVRRLANPKYPQEYLRNMGAIQAEKAAFSW